LACLIFSITALAEKETISLRFSTDKLSVRIENACLGTVLKQFKKEKDVNIKCDQDMQRIKINAQFENLATETGLRRILRNTDHSLVFDKEGRIRQIIVTGKGNDSAPSVLVDSDPAVPMVVKTDPAFRVVKNCLPPDGQAEPEIVTDPAFKVIRNAHPPRGQFMSQKGFTP